LGLLNLLQAGRYLCLNARRIIIITQITANMTPEIQAKIDQWLNSNIDEASKEAIRAAGPDELADAFYRNLEFGTGGLRGIMGVGSNRMNKYTLGMATQGFANYLNKTLTGQIKVAVAHDSRNNSRFFAETTAAIFAANGCTVYLFEALRPTPELSFAMRSLGCHAGVVCTASHNPKEYNGYKAYWNDGAQLMPPHDKNVITEVNNIASVDEVKWSGGSGTVHAIGAEMDEAYITMLKGLSLQPEIIAAQHDLKIVYTSIHGTGITVVPQALAKFGFTNITIVDEQKTPDGNFPTVIYPNPEEKDAMQIGLNNAIALDADILLGTDPDADRVGIAIKNHKGEWVLMNGNQTGVLLFNYILETRRQKGLAQPNDFICKTIVTTPLIDAFAAGNGVECVNTLTGFKFIAELIRQNEGVKNFICGGEESFGYMVGDKVRDKDAVASVCMISEMAAVAKSEGKSMFDKLIDIYLQYGLYKEDLVSITKKGMKGAEEIQDMMKGYRENPPTEIAGQKVVTINDYQLQTSKGMLTGNTVGINMPHKSNVLIFFTEDGTMIAARPSGTEPKIKFYFSVKEPLARREDFDAVYAKLGDKINAIIDSMGLRG
jgi:phosphoglucomutase